MVHKTNDTGAAKMMDASSLRNTLSTHLQSNGITCEAGGKRLHNIKWVERLPRDGLLCQVMVKQILIHTTKYGEEIYMQYPGKESERTDDKCRPWDFLPRVAIRNSYGDDLSFKNIWDALFEGLEPKKHQIRPELQALATVFFRMAYMDDHIRSEEQISFRVRHIEYVGKEERLTSEDEQSFPSLYLYSPAEPMVDSFADLFPTCGMSLEAFLHYNNLLAWNEDCKYYYRDTRIKGKKWMGAAGRINNLLTHISVLGYLLGELTISDVFYKFSTGAGVAPAAGDEIVRITSGLVQGRRGQTIF